MKVRKVYCDSKYSIYTIERKGKVAKGEDAAKNKLERAKEGIEV